MLGLFIVLLTLLSASPQPLTARLRARESLVFALGFLALVTVAAGLTWRHLRGLFDNYSSRLVTMPGSLLMAQPCIAAETTLFTAMQPPSYVLGGLAGKQLFYREFSPDAFHPASAPGVSEAWVVLAGSGSQIIRFDLNGVPNVMAPTRVEAEDAEEPTVSPDGRWLAFIREKQGRGSLWVKNLQPNPGEDTAVNPEPELAGSEFDVLDVAFDPRNREMVFSAQAKGWPGLFRVGILSRRIMPTGYGPPVRYPAFSRDGQWLAYSRQERGNWNLWMSPVDGRGERRLTRGECNSISPVWLPDSRALVYATDCGRGVGLTALTRIQALP
jgi:hypothetical protein